MTGYRYGPQPGPGEVRKGVQFNIDEQVWEKFKLIAEEDLVTLPVLITELVTAYCSMRHTDLDTEAGRAYPNLIGAAE